MALGLIVAFIATFIGYIFAYTVTRVNVPCKGFLKTIGNAAHPLPCPSCCPCPSFFCSASRA